MGSCVKPDCPQSVVHFSNCDSPEKADGTSPPDHPATIFGFSMIGSFRVTALVDVEGR
jgi:hypothetical protein